MFSKLVFGDFIYKVNISNINCLFFLFSHVKLFDNCAKFFKLIPFFFSIYFCIRKWNHVSRQTKLDRKSRDGRINWHNFTCQFLRKERRVKRRRMDRWRRRSGAREFATLKVELYTTGAERERERESSKEPSRSPPWADYGPVILLRRCRKNAAEPAPLALCRSDACVHALPPPLPSFLSPAFLRTFSLSRGCCTPFNAAGY